MECACAYNTSRSLWPWCSRCSSQTHTWGQSKSRLLVGREQTVGDGLDDNDPIEVPGDRRGSRSTKTKDQKKHAILILISDVCAQSHPESTRYRFRAVRGPHGQDRPPIGTDRRGIRTPGLCRSLVGSTPQWLLDGFPLHKLEPFTEAECLSNS